MTGGRMSHRAGDHVEGRFLDPALSWVYAGEPGPGYAVGARGELWRNGKLAGEVLSVCWDREKAAWWVSYRAPAGGVMDRFDRACAGRSSAVGSRP